MNNQNVNTENVHGELLVCLSYSCDFQFIHHLLHVNLCQIYFDFRFLLFSGFSTYVVVLI